MHALIAYDISDNRSRRRFFAYLREKGLPAQKSVFECELCTEEIAAVLREAAALDMQPQDSVVIYPLCRRCARGAVILGRGKRILPEAWTII